MAGFNGSAFVNFNRPFTAPGQDVFNLCGSLFEDYSELVNVLAVMNQLQSGVSSTVGFANIEEWYGLPSGTGQLAFNSVNGAVQQWQANGSQLMNLITQYG